MVRFTGRFGSLQDFSDRMTALAQDAYADASHRAAVAVQQQLERQYGSGKDPYGIPWPNKKDGSGRSYLQKTGKMKRETRAVRGVGGIRVTAPKPAGFHQTGTKYMYARSLVPYGSDMPQDWRSAIEGAIREAVRGRR